MLLRMYRCNGAITKAIYLEKFEKQGYLLRNRSSTFSPALINPNRTQYIQTKLLKQTKSKNQNLQLPKY
jgi:hypothetical protein